jgi:uncharacterized membrane protein
MLTAGNSALGLPRWLTADRFFVVAGLVFGLGFVAVTPPFQAPDEPAHFLRAYSLSEGQVLPSTRRTATGEAAGAEIPESLYELIGAVDTDRVRFHSDRKVSEEQIVRAFSIPLASGPRSWHDLYTMMYAPVAYLPQALAIALGRLAGLPPLSLFYLARLANLACWIFAVWTAIRLAPFFKWPLCLLALNPMSIFLAASVSPDTAASGLSFLILGAGLRLAHADDAPVRGRDLARFAAAALLLSLAKQVYLVLSLILLLVPAGKFGGTVRKAAWVGGILAAQIGLCVLWSLLAIRGHTPAVVGGDAGTQFWFVVWHPWQFAQIFLRTHVRQAGFIIDSFAGTLGWLDTHLPRSFLFSYLAAAVLLSVFFARPPQPLDLRRRVFFFALGIAPWCLVLGYQYLTWTPLYARIIEGTYGRYLIPISPFLLLAFAGGRKTARMEMVACLVPLYLTALLSEALAVTLRRYWL